MEKIEVSQIINEIIPNDCPYCYLEYTEERKPMVICFRQHMSCSVCLVWLTDKFQNCPCCRQKFISKSKIYKNRLVQDLKEVKIKIKKQNEEIFEEYKRQKQELINKLKIIRHKNIQLTTKIKELQQQTKILKYLKARTCPICNYELKNLFQELQTIKNNNNYNNNNTSIKIKSYVEITNEQKLNCLEIINELQLIPNMISLSIQYQPLGEKKQIINIMNKLPNLQQLYFNCYNQFNQQCLIYASKMKNLECLFYNLDIVHGIQYFIDSNQFQQSNKISKQNPLPIKEIFQLTNKLPKLNNIWIGKQQDICSAIQIRKWKHIAIGKDGYSGCQKFSPKSWIALKSVKQLISLSLYQIDKIQNNNLSEVILSNSNSLVSIMLRSCHGVNQIEINCIKQCQQLKSLYLTNSHINGLFLESLPCLKYLYLSNCHTITSKNMSNALKKMENLQSLTLSKHNWVNDLVVSSIKNTISLKHLNLLQCSQTKNKSFPIIANLTKLNVLHLGYTNVSNFGLLEIIKNLPDLKKFGLSGLKISQHQIKQVGKIVPKLTHLDIRQCKSINGETLADRQIFPSLRFIKIKGSSVGAQFLHNKRPQINII